MSVSHGELHPFPGPVQQLTDAILYFPSLLLSSPVGVDLGTTYSCVGVWQNDRVEIIANDQGNRTTPSYVAFTDTERLIGDAAKNQVAMNPHNTVFDAKRLIGRKFTDAEVQADMKVGSLVITSFLSLVIHTDILSVL